MGKQSIVVIEDEEDILELIRFNLCREGYDITGSVTGEDGLRSVTELNPDAVLLDLMLPGMDGLEVCKKLKSEDTTANIPILMISAKGEESDIIAGLEMGADDYVTKPFSPKILNARVHAMLRRSQAKQVAPADRITIHALKMNLTRFQATLDGHPLPLTKDEFQLLFFLARHPGWVFTRYQIVDGVKGEGYVVTERAVDVRIAGLRKKLGPHSDYIETVRGVGYRFRES